MKQKHYLLLLICLSAHLLQARTTNFLDGLHRSLEGSVTVFKNTPAIGLHKEWDKAAALAYYIPAAPEAKTPQIYAGTATLASLTATGTNLKWYAAPTGGEPLALTTALVDGSTYYVSQTSVAGESTRTAVKAKRISESTQTVCNGATVASLMTTPTAIPEVTTHWFTSATGGTALEGTAPLTPGDYYVEQRLPEVYTVLDNLTITAMTSDADGNLYIVTKYAEDSGVYSTIQKISPDGTNIQTLGTGLSYIIGIAVDSSGTIYITDFGYDLVSQGKSTVKKMNNDGTNIQVIADHVPNQRFHAIDIDMSGVLYIGKSVSTPIPSGGYSTAFFITKMNNDGTILGTLSIPQNGESPKQICVSPSGNIYTLIDVIVGPNIIVKMNNDGSEVQTIAQGTDPDGFYIDADGTIYFTDGSSNLKKLKKMNSDGTGIQIISTIGNPSNSINPRAEFIEKVLGDFYFIETNSGILRSLKKITQLYTSNRIKVTVSPLVAKPTVVSPVTYTQNSTATALSATTAAATSLKWYTTATGGTGSATAPTPATSALGNTSYWVASTNENGCESPRAEIVVSVGTPATHLHFDGVNDHINIATVVASGSSYTKEAMIQPNAISGGYNIVSSSGDVFWIYQNKLAAGHSANFLYVSASATALLNEWNHVAVTYDAPTTTMKLYLNGSLVSENNAVPAATGNALQIGAYASAALFNGSIDEVRIWNRALSAAELNRRKNCELAGTEQGLLAYFNFNQGVDGISNTGLTTLTNAVSGGNNGTLNNFALASSTSNWTLGSPIVSGISIPSVPTVTTPIQIGQGGTATALTATSGGTGLMWYTAATDGTGTTTAPIPSTATAGTTSFWVSSTNANGCESERTEIVFTVTEATAAPEAKTPQIYAGTATLAALTATGTNLKWYAAPTVGEPLALTTALVDGSTYYVSQTVDGLESDRIAVTSKKISEGTQTLCNGATVANLTATPSENSIIQWFTSASGGTALEETAAIASGTFYVEQVNDVTSNRVGVNVIVESVQPLFRQVASICLGDELLPLPTISLNGITGTWSPALNATATTTYSFNPTPGQCVTDATVTMTILVNTAPNISYADVDTNYALGAAITPLVPNNTGGLPIPTNLATPLISDIYTANNQYINSISVDDLNNVFACDFYSYSAFKITSSTTFTTIGNFNTPFGIASDAFGDIFVAERNANQIKKTAADGTITTVASGFSAPNDVVVDADGTIFVIDQQAVKKIATDGTISVVASGFHFRSNGLSLDNNGNIYVAETGHLNIKKIDPNGIVTMLGGGYDQPSDVAADPVGNVYIADSFNNKVKRFAIDGTLTTLVSEFNGPTSVAVDSEGNVYYSNYNSIKKITFTTYSISPTLPEGLSFNSSTGVISGTPLVASNSTTYTISTMNSCGTNNATITFATCTDTAGVPVAVTPVSYFIESVATPLTATTGMNGTGLLWYTTATGGTGSVTAPTPDTATLGTTSYWVSSTGENSCESARTEIVVTVTEAPPLPAPTALVNQVYAGTATIAALTATGTNLQWYAAATGGEPLEATAALVDGTTYYVSQTVDGLESARTPVTVKNISEATQIFCNEATVANLAATPSPNNTVKWFADATGGTALATTTALESGSYYVEQTQPAQNPVELPVYFPFSDMEGSISPYYSGELAVDAAGTLYVNNDTGYRFLKSDENGNVVYSTGLFVPGTPGKTSIAVDASGRIYVTNATTGIIKRFNNDGGEGTVIVSGLIGVRRIAVDASGTIYVTEPENNVVKKMNADGTNIQTLGSGFNNPDGIVVDASGSIYILDAGNNAVKKMNNAGTTIQTLVNGLSNPKGMALDQFGNIYIVEPQTIKKINNDGTNTEIIYTTYDSFESLAEIAVAPSGHVYFTNRYGIVTEIQKFLSTVSSNRVLVNVAIEEVPEAPTVTTPVNYTQNDTATALMAATEAPGLLWYDAATGGTGSATAPTPDTATLGTTSYWVSSTGENSCESARTEIVVTVTEAPALPAPTALVNQIYAGTATIAALTATGTNLQWYVAATGGQPLAAATALEDGTIYYVSQTVEGVESLRTAVTAKKVSEATQTLCSAATVANLITTPSENGTVEWFATATDGIALDETAALASGSYYVEQTVLENTSNRVLVTVVVDAAVAAPTVSSPIGYVQGAVASALTAASGSVGLVWYPVATGGTGSTSAPIPSTATVGSTSYWVASVNANGCESARTEIVVGITQDILTIGSHPSDANITGGQDTSFAASVNGVTINYQWQVSHDGGITFTDLTNDGIYSGVTSATLTLNNVPISMDGKQYKVKVSNGSEAVSNAATLTVSVPDFNNSRFWKNKGMAGFSAGVAADSYLALDANNTPYVAFRDDSNGEKTSVMKFDGTSWVLVGAAGFSDSNYVYSFSMAFDASNLPYVAYLNVNNSIEVKYFNGTSWTNVGTSGLESEAEGLSLKMDPSGIPFVAYTDYSANYKTSVRKLVGNSWTLVGNAGFSAGESYDTSFAIDPQGTPYVVYRDDSNDGKATAMKFNGTAWVSVGSSSGFSPDVAFYTSLAIDRAGTPYATFVDYFADEPVVMKFNGSEWVMVGTAGFASGVLYSSSIVLDGSGTPFLVYQDFENSNKVTVKRFDGTSWTTVGASGFSMGAGNFTAIDLDSSGTPYVVFIDAALGNKVTVMKFNGSNEQTIWENGSWDNGVPSFTMKAIIDDTLVLSSDLEASALEVTTNGSITVATGTVLTVSGEIINNNTPAHFVVEDHGILLQQQDVQNEGDITVNVNSFPLYRQDYTLWSSPVKEQNLRSFSPQTLFNRFSSYDTAAGTTGQYVQEIFTTSDAQTKVFEPAKGYMIRMPNNWVEFVEESIAGTPYAGVFKGVPQNGPVSIALSTANTGSNLVGNPYPSPVSIDMFLEGNPDIEQTIYYWRKRNDQSGSGYATYNALGLVSTQPIINGLDIENVINPGQGFFVLTNGATQLHFNNAMRSTNGNGTFLRNPQQEKHRFWLGLSSSAGTVGQTLIGYATGATAGVDNGFDGAYFNDSTTALTSLIEGNEYAIQGLSVPFDPATTVPLGFKTTVPGTYTVSLSNFDGLFADDQDIFIKDLWNGQQLHNLKLSDYSFPTDAGVFNDRFVIVYQATLGTDKPETDVNDIIVFKQQQNIHINTWDIQMKKVELFDIRGRLIHILDNVNGTKAIISNLSLSNQLLLVKITSDANVITTKRIIY